MRFLFFLTILLIVGCTNHSEKLTPQYIRQKFGDFSGDEKIKTLPVDVSKTPIQKKINHHPEQFTYLDEVEISHMIYNSDSLMVTGFLVTPREEGRYPVIIYNRGGNRDLGQLLVGHAVEIFARLASQGFVVAASNYRGNSGSEGMEEFGGADVTDIPNLIYALDQVQKADTENVGLFGLSRGGMMTYLFLKEYGDMNGRIKCAVNIGGITDLKTTIQYHPEIREVCVDLIPGFEANEKNVLKDRSAIHWTQKLPDIPLLILHGTEDQHVDYSQIPPFADSLSKYQKPYKLLSYEGENHGIVGKKEEVMTEVINWMGEYLK